MVGEKEDERDGDVNCCVLIPADSRLQVREP
jgi:hypothetical protein